MKLYLYNDHTAAAEDDRSHTIYTVPPTDGMLSVAGVTVRVTADGQSPMPSLKATGDIHGIYVTSGNIRYVLIKPRINREGVPVSCIEERSTMLEMRANLDEKEKRLEELTQTVHNLKGIYERDALWFLTQGKTNIHKENLS